MTHRAHAYRVLGARLERGDAQLGVRLRLEGVDVGVGAAVVMVVVIRGRAVLAPSH